MRINQNQIKIIKEITRECFGDKSQVYLFGSRVDDRKKGGDIDLYIETDVKENILDQKLKMLRLLHNALGEQKIDIVINNYTVNKYIYKVAKSEGIAL